MEKEKLYYTAAEIAELLGVSVSQGYKYASILNKELNDLGYLTVTAKVPKKYLERRLFGFGEGQQ